MNELKHHGILGQKWGVRRYQPYPSGQRVKGGKEVGAATKVKQRKSFAPEPRKPSKYEKGGPERIKIDPRFSKDGDGFTGATKIQQRLDNDKSISGRIRNKQYSKAVATVKDSKEALKELDAIEKAGNGGKIAKAIRNKQRSNAERDLKDANEAITELKAISKNKAEKRQASADVVQKILDRNKIKIKELEKDGGKQTQDWYDTKETIKNVQAILQKLDNGQKLTKTEQKTLNYEKFALKNF